MYSRPDVAPSSAGSYRDRKSDVVVGQQVLLRISLDDAQHDFLGGTLPSFTPRKADTPQLFRRTITEFPGEPYALREPIGVEIEETAPCQFIARFREANIAMPGETLDESLGNLASHILDVYEVLSEPDTKLARSPKKQLSVLRRFLIVER